MPQFLLVLSPLLILLLNPGTGVQTRQEDGGETWAVIAFLRWFQTFPFFSLPRPHRVISA